MSERKLSEQQMIEYLEQYADSVDEVPAKERDSFKAMVEEGCKKGLQVALHIKAYSCYGGNSMWECDWVASRDCLLKLVDIDENPFYFNTLGYIFYYGRCNNGIPEYDKAFQYFSVGAAHGVYESMYKLADMFFKGNGCIKSPKAAAKIIISLYDENKAIFESGVVDCKFADIALRMGGLFERGDGVDKDIEEAYAYYLEAKLAIDKRVEEYNYYGDSKVQKNVNDAINRVTALISPDFFKKFEELESPAPIGMLLENSVGLDISIDEYKGYFRIRAKSFSDENTSGTVLVNVPTIKYCKLADEITLYLDKDSEIINEDIEFPYTAFITGIVYDQDDDVWNFLYRDKQMLSFRCDRFFFYK